MLICIRMGVEQEQYVELSGKSDAERARSLLNSSFVQNQIPTIIDSVFFSYYDPKRTLYFKESDWPQRVASLFLEALAAYEPNKGDWKPFYRMHIKRGMDAEIELYYRRVLRQNYSQMREDSLDLDLMLTGLRYALGELGALPVYDLFKDTMLNSMASIMAQMDKTSFIDVIDDDMWVELIFAHGTKKYPSIELDVEYHGLNCSATHIKPDAAFKRLLDMVNIGGERYLRYIRHYLGYDLTEDRLAQWSDLFKLERDDIEVLCSEMSLVRMLDGARTGGIPCYFGKFKLKELLKLKPGFSIFLMSGFVGLVNFKTGDVSYLKLENTTKFIATDDDGEFKVVMSGNHFANPGFLEGHVGSENIRAYIKPTEKPGGMGRGKGKKGPKKPVFNGLKGFLI